VEASALQQAGVAGIHGRSPLLRVQSDDKLVGLIRQGSEYAFEALMTRYQARLLAFCRHMLGSREDAEDVLQEVFAAAYSAMRADDRPLNVRPWLYRIARNRSLNHLRRVQPIGVDSMDVHLADNGQSTADRVQRREDFRLLLADVQALPETQRSALLLREIDALSYDQIAAAMDTTVPSVKSLLVRARVSLAETAEARQLSCAEVRCELGEVAEGLRKISPPVRRHVKTCERCAAFRKQLRHNNRALAAVLPAGPLLLLLKKLVLVHLGGSATAGGGGAGAGAATGTAATGTAGTAAAGSAVAGSAAAGGTATGLVSAGAAAVATKAAAGLAAAALVGVGAVEVHRATVALAPATHSAPARVYVPATGGTRAPTLAPRHRAIHRKLRTARPKTLTSAAAIVPHHARVKLAKPRVAPSPPPTAQKTETASGTVVLPPTEAAPPTQATSSSTASSTTSSPSSPPTSGGTSAPAQPAGGDTSTQSTTARSDSPPPATTTTDQQQAPSAQQPAPPATSPTATAPQ
jgi:RNA polymerase sigma factor (sigma-70 family)